MAYTTACTTVQAVIMSLKNISHELAICLSAAVSYKRSLYSTYSLIMASKEKAIIQ